MPTATNAKSITKPTAKHRLASLRTFLLYLLIPSLFFSYHPVITLGATTSMNLELSLPIIILVIYDLVSLADFVRLAIQHGLRQSLGGFTDAHFFALSLFPLYLTLSALWSSNPLRGILTAGLFWAIFIAIFSTYQLLLSFPTVVKNTTITHLKRIFYISTAAICVFCWLQCILDLAGLDRNTTLMCAGCTYRSFGFPHPNGFAIEPQFMGNLLLAPCLLLLFSLLRKFNFKHLLLELFFVTTLFLTFSRGAIYSFVLGAAIITIYYIHKHKSAKPLLSTAKPLLSAIPICIAFLISLLAQGIMAELSPTNDTFVTGITKSIHQLSLGKIDLRQTAPVPTSTTAPVPTSTTAPASDDPTATPSPAEFSTTPVENSQENGEAQTAETSSYDGYVAESTDIRLNLTHYALDLWHSNPKILLLGVGLGGAGTSLHTTYPTIFGPKEIVQNEYASLLLETGLVGIIVAVIAIITVISLARKSRHLPIFAALVIAYACSLLFFSGLPNALHIYLAPALILMI